MVSKASEDFPEPESPVITISASRGKSKSMFLRLCVLAPLILIVSIDKKFDNLKQLGNIRLNETYVQPDFKQYLF
jgi:hypothetical protein